ncbi:MAG: hypothetical protein ACYCX2_02815 [Christensenellales bacterium]
MNRHLTGAHRISFTAMVSVLSLIFLYLAIVLPTSRLAFYFLSSAFVAALVIENELGLAILSFVVTSLLAMLLLGFVPALFPYILLFGHYGIGKALFERMKRKAVAFAAKLAYFNVFLLTTYLLAKEVLFKDIEAVLPLWALWLIAQAVFVVYDLAYTLVITLYYNKFRQFLMK